MEPGGLCNARAMSLMDSPTLQRSHNSSLPAAHNPPGRPSLATYAPPIMTTPKNLPCCTDRLNPPRPSSPGKRSGVGERLQAHRRGEGRLPGVGAMQDARSLQERLLRLAQQAALKEEGSGRPSHREDPRDP